MKENSRRKLKSITENAFKKCFDDWIIRYHKCIILEETYFDNIGHAFVAGFVFAIQVK